MKYVGLGVGTSALVLTLTALLVGGAAAGLVSFNFFSATDSSAHSETGAQVQRTQDLGSTNEAATPVSSGWGGMTQTSGCQQIASSDSGSETPEFSCAYVISASQPQAAALKIASDPSNAPQAYACSPLDVASDGEGGLGIGADCTAVNSSSDASWAS